MQEEENSNLTLSKAIAQIQTIISALQTLILSLNLTKHCLYHNLACI